MALLFIKVIILINQGQRFLASLIVVYFILIIFLWYKYYQTGIKPFIIEKPSIMLDGFFLVFGAMFGVIFSDVFLQPLMKFANSGNYFGSFLAILLAIILFLIAFVFILYVRIVYGVAIIKE
jgi:hypothetical protein